MHEPIAAAEDDFSISYGRRAVHIVVGCDCPRCLAGVSVDAMQLRIVAAYQNLLSVVGRLHGPICAAENFSVGRVGPLECSGRKIEFVELSVRRAYVDVIAQNQGRGLDRVSRLKRPDSLATEET